MHIPTFARDVARQMPSPQSNRAGSVARPSAEMTGDGSARESAKDQPKRSSDEGSVLLKTCKVLMPVKFEHFNLGERVNKEDHPAMPAGSGLAVVSPGRILCTVGPRTEWVNLTAEVHSEAPPAVTADYEDVVERSFFCASGSLGLLDWKLELIEVLPLPGEGTYRLRFHSRNMDDGSGPADGPRHNVGESLIQLWPAPSAAGAELKITSSTGRFWHPFATFSRSGTGNG
jgi:hypothetical protein